LHQVAKEEANHSHTTHCHREKQRLGSSGHSAPSISSFRLFAAAREPTDWDR
jgi:hypothetical protein